MTRIEKGMFALATLLGTVSIVLLSSRSASAQTYYCDFTPAGLETCNCSAPPGYETICVSNTTTKLQWCTLTALAPCVAGYQIACPNDGSAATGDCSTYTYKNPQSRCAGNPKGTCIQSNDPG